MKISKTVDVAFRKVKTTFPPRTPLVEIEEEMWFKSLKLQVNDQKPRPPDAILFDKPFSWKRGYSL